MALPRINWGRMDIRTGAQRSPPAAQPLLSRLPLLQGVVASSPRVFQSSIFVSTGDLPAEMRVRTSVCTQNCSVPGSIVVGGCPQLPFYLLPLVLVLSGHRRLDLCPPGLVGDTANTNNACPADPHGLSASQTSRLAPCATTLGTAPSGQCPLGR